MLSPSAKKLASLFKQFPTVGSKTAERFVFYLIGLPNDKVKELIQAIAEVKNKTKPCSFCSKIFESEGSLCEICSNPSRDKSLICVIEKESDLEAIEKTGHYKGLYFILNKPEKAGLLNQYAKDNNVKEIILALNPTQESKNLALFLKRKLETKTTLLGVGLPLGGELEYADEDTIASSLENRR